MEITTSQSKTKTETAPKPEQDAPPKRESTEDEDPYMDRTDDLVARVRRAKEAAQRKMESFGDVSEYEVTKIYGRKKESQAATTGPTEDEQPS
jgi:hypothetical protein